MPNFSKSSADRLSTCDSRLQQVCNDAIEILDFTVLCGNRSKVDQDLAVAQGKSRTPYPTSKHNTLPSRAVDIAPYPIDWNDIERFKALNEVMQSCAEKRGIKLNWGGNFTKLKDYDHWELSDEEIKKCSE